MDLVMLMFCFYLACLGRKVSWKSCFLFNLIVLDGILVFGFSREGVDVYL